jgi:D-Tyr-tRNAtyr deacylase
MVAIVQRAKNIVVGRTHLGDGIVVFLSHEGIQLECVADKVLRIRLWDRWKKSVIDLEHTVLCILQQSRNREKLDEVQAVFAQKYCHRRVHVIFSQDNVFFVNDGPCTFLL